MKFIYTAILSVILISCSNNTSTEKIDIQGHRGARGSMPENTIPGFFHAVDLNVDTIEMDVVVTEDEHILVSHEPWFNHEISTKPDGNPVNEEEERGFNIYDMTYEETRQFDVGKRGHPSFPNQEKMEVQKPLLRDAIRSIETYTDENGLPSVKYNIEMKSEPEYYEIYVPQPEEFAALLNDVLMELDLEFDIEDRVIIQSFDPAALIAFRNVNPNMELAMLVSDRLSIKSYIDTLGFTPDIWSPNYQRVTLEMLDDAHKRGMKVIPWTVNTTKEIQNLVNMGVDGIITDYPDSASALFE